MQTNADGSMRIYKWIGIQSSTLGMQPIALTEDGDYHINIFFEASYNGVTQKYVAQYTVPVRTSIFVTDESGEYHVKDSGFYYDAVKLDFADRKDVVVTVNGVYAGNGYVISKPGTYSVCVYGAGFLSEKFTFRVHSQNYDHIFLRGKNLTAVLGEGIYQAESYFSVDWLTNMADVVAYYSYNGGDTVKYEKDTVISEPGAYTFSVSTASGKETQYMAVMLVPDTCPSHNLNVLSGNRFNNFITKWYEVRDNESGEYLCFNINEYYKAYDAAMSFEERKVTYYGNRYVYGDMQYATSDAVSRAMSEAAVKNIKLVYYDVDNSTVEKQFSNNLFDGTVYLNGDFKFMCPNTAETSSVILIDENGGIHPIAYNTVMDSYSLCDGKYTVVESDKYGNEIEYSVVIDRTAPSVHITTDSGVIEIENGKTYTVSRFSVSALSDALDPYALVCVDNTDFALANELTGDTYGERGRYFIKAYDRNGNVVRCTVNIEREEQIYKRSDSDSAVFISLLNGYSAQGLKINGTVTDLNGGGDVKLDKSAELQDARISVKSSTGEEFTVRIEIPPMQANALNEHGGIGIETVIYIVMAALTVSSATAGVILICIGRRRRWH